MSDGRSDRIDQLRGLAALAVVVCHARVSAYSVPAGQWQPGWLALVLGFGYLGVPLFFVISGFCIHLPQARALARSPAAAQARWSAFFARRFWRLYPPYLASIVGALVLLSVVERALPASWLAIGAQALLVQTFHVATFEGVNPPAWTLAVEAQLYAAYPVVRWLIARWGGLRALAVVLTITLAYRGLLCLDPFPSWFRGPAWELFVARWFEWALGAFVAEWFVGRATLPRIVTRPALALVAFVVPVALEWQRWRIGAYAIMEPLYGVAFALVLCAALAREPRRRGSAVGRYLASVGLFSYSLYLVHRPIQLAVEPLVRRAAAWPLVVEHHVPSSLLIMAATIPLVVWAARVFYRYVEAPSIERSRRVTSTPRAARGRSLDSESAA